MYRYWNAAYQEQLAEEAAEKKQRQPRKNKGVKRGVRLRLANSSQLPKNVEAAVQEAPESVTEMT
jgi:hypothetical protein